MGIWVDYGDDSPGSRLLHLAEIVYPIKYGLEGETIELRNTGELPKWRHSPAKLCNNYILICGLNFPLVALFANKCT